MTDNKNTKDYRNTGWHGFSRLFDFLKATASLSLTLGGILSTVLWLLLTNALDGRYASAALASEVQTNGVTARQVKAKLDTLQTSVDAIESSLVLDQLFEMKAKSCHASSRESREFFAHQIQTMQQKYQDMTGSKPFIPACADLQ